MPADPAALLVGSAAGMAIALAVLAWSLPHLGRRRAAPALLARARVPDAGHGTRAGSVSSGVRAPSTEDVAAAMVLLAVALQSGCGVVEALEAVAAVAPPAAARELSVVAAALRWGVPDKEAWDVVSPGWARTALALRLAGASGVPPSTLLAAGADDMRAARLAALEVGAARLGVRLVLPLGLAFLPAFVLTTVVPVVLAMARDALR